MKKIEIDGNDLLPIKVGDLVAIRPNILDDMRSHCHEFELPEHNYGKVVSVITPLQKDKEGRPLHPYVYNAKLGKHNYITVDLKTEQMGFLENMLMRLY